MLEWKPRLIALVLGLMLVAVAFGNVIFLPINYVWGWA